MKKSFVLLLALVILVSGTACYAQNELLKEKDQVHFEEKVIYGDKSIVDGVTIEMYNEYENQLYWHTTYEVEAEPKENTEYTFYPWKYYTASNDWSGSLDFGQDYNNIYIGTYENDTDEADYTGLDLAMKQLYDELPAGEEKTIMVYLKDYMKYYSFGFDLELPADAGKESKNYYDYRFFWEKELLDDIERLEQQGSDNRSLEQAKKCLKDLKNFQEFFKIPVLETEVYHLAMAKDEEGLIIGTAESGLHGGSANGMIEIPEAPKVEGADSFSLGTYSVFEGGDCYFTFNARTVEGNTVDTSLIPGGYGIYHFNYDSKKGEIDSKHIKMVYALNPGVELLELRLDESSDNLLLFTAEGARVYMSVIDRETMTLVDTFDIGDSENGYSCWTFEDYMVISSDSLSVYVKGEDKRYTIKFSVDKKAIDDILDIYENAESIPNFNSSFAWDGKTLLITNDIYHEHMGRSCSFLLAAVDETGLIYYGTYTSSLLTSDIMYAPCHPDNNKANPVIVKWNK